MKIIGHPKKWEVLVGGGIVVLVILYILHKKHTLGFGGRDPTDPHCKINPFDSACRDFPP